MQSLLVTVATLLVMTFLSGMVEGHRNIPYHEMTDGLKKLPHKLPMCHNKRPQLAIVTGANQGIGYQIARQLYRSQFAQVGGDPNREETVHHHHRSHYRGCMRPMHVILACRSLDRAHQAIEKIVGEYPDALQLGHVHRPEAWELDLDDLDRTLKPFLNHLRRYDAELHGDGRHHEWTEGAEHPVIDILINNAGTADTNAGSSKAAVVLTKEDAERVVKINYHSTVRLTEALLPFMRRGHPGVWRAEAAAEAHPEHAEGNLIHHADDGDPDGPGRIIMIGSRFGAVGNIPKKSFQQAMNAAGEYDPSSVGSKKKKDSVNKQKRGRYNSPKRKEEGAQAKKPLSRLENVQKVINGQLEEFMAVAAQSPATRSFDLSGWRDRSQFGPAYSLSKVLLLTYTRARSEDFIAAVRWFTVCPGYISTRLTGHSQNAASTEEGADTALWLALQSEHSMVETPTFHHGGFYAERRLHDYVSGAPIQASALPPKTKVLDSGVSTFNLYDDVGEGRAEEKKFKERKDGMIHSDEL